MKTYTTSEVAKMAGVHPNTVRLYERLRLIPTPERLPNGYRVFCDYHIEQCRLIRLAFRVEVTQNGLRKKIIKMLEASAAGDFDAAALLINDYIAGLIKERSMAEEAVEIVRQLLSGEPICGRSLRRRKVSDMLGISMDTLRNWEMNGLLTVKRRENGYRVYTDDDIRRLKIIRALRCANYSLEAILRLTEQLSDNPDADIRAALNTPRESDEIISVCDRLIASLSEAEKNARIIADALENMKLKFS